MANPNTALAQSPGCSAPELYQTVTDYCFGQADEDARRVVEAHLQTCAVCRRDAAKLTAAVDVLRHDAELMPPISPMDMAATFGLSAKLRLLFGGHIWMMLISSLLYGALYVITLWTLIAYQLDRYANHVMMRAPLVFIFIVISTLAIFWLCWRRTIEGKDYTLAICVVGLLLAALSAYGLSWWILPTTPIEGDATPQQTYFRNTGAFLGLITFCLLIPYHFIVTMQRELSEGKHAAIKKLLNRDKESVLPRGTLYLSIRMLISMLSLLATSTWWFLEISFRKLSPGAYRHLYVTLEMLIWFTYFALGVGWMIWYYRMINELKRECLIAQSFD